jgi:hypothetical protein
MQDKEDRKLLLAAIKKANLINVNSSNPDGVPPKVGDINSVGSAAAATALPSIKAKFKSSKVRVTLPDLAKLFFFLQA